MDKQVLNFFNSEELTLRFIQGKSLLFNNNKEGLESSFGEEVPKFPITSSMGLFSDDPDYNTFDPSVTEEDWTPKEEDFIHPVFRVFSEVIIDKYGIPIDFTTPGLIQGSMKKLLQRTVNPDHSYGNIANGLGVVEEVMWQEGYEIEGVKVPAGILARLKLDAKANPRIARGILANPPWINSTSVTVKFKWEKSHPKDENFWEKVGSYDKDGELYRIIATEITLYPELSLVWTGADPFAQIVKDGKINDPQRAKSYYRFNAEPECSGLKCSFDLGSIITHNKNNSTMEFNNQIFDLLKIEIPEGTTISSWEELSAFIKKTVETPMAEITQLREEIAELKQKQIPEGARLISEDEESFIESFKEAFGDKPLTELKEAVEMGEKYQKDTQEKALSFYRLIAGDNVDKTIEESIQNASLKEALAFEKLYGDMVEKQFPLVCQDCNSQNVSRRSSIPSGEGDSGKEGKNSFESFKDRQRKTHSKRPSDLHK